jgi:hypothetical protein
MLLAAAFLDIHPISVLPHANLLKKSNHNNLINEQMLMIEPENLSYA